MQAFSGKLGLPDPKLSLGQHKHGSSRRVVALARQALEVVWDRAFAVPADPQRYPLSNLPAPHHANHSIVGISIGCILGMVPLLFVDTFKKVWKMLHRGADIILRVTLCLVLTRLSKICRSHECSSTSLTVMAKVRADNRAAHDRPLRRSLLICFFFSCVHQGYLTKKDLTKALQNVDIELTDVGRGGVCFQ